MPFIPLDNAVKLAINSSYLGETDITNVLYFTTTNGAGWPFARMFALAQFVTNTLLTDLVPWLSSSFSFNTITVTTMETEPQSQIVSTDDLPLAGAQTGGGLPGNCALCITHRTGNIGRSYRGRTYLCGLPEAKTTNNLVDADAFAGINTAWEDFLTVLHGTTDDNFVVASFHHNGAPRVAGVATQVVTSAARDRRIDTQRRRLPKA